MQRTNAIRLALPASTHAQRGQAMSEFIAACAVLVPLFMGIIYVAKYSDVKSSTIQASRYAAFERAFDPTAKHKPAPVLTEETRARFFTDGARNDGAFTKGDTTANLKPDQFVTAFWRDMKATRMLNQYADVSLAIDEKGLGGAFNKILDTEGKVLKLNPNGLYYSNVEVPMANIAHFEPLKKINLKIGATTALLGDAWSAGGSADVTTHARRAVPASVIPSLPAADFLFEWLTDSPAPQFGCISPDVVPKDRLESYKAVGYCKN